MTLRVFNLLPTGVRKRETEDEGCTEARMIGELEDVVIRAHGAEGLAGSRRAFRLLEERSSWV